MDCFNPLQKELDLSPTIMSVMVLIWGPVLEPRTLNELSPVLRPLHQTVLQILATSVHEYHKFVFCIGLYFMGTSTPLDMQHFIFRRRRIHMEVIADFYKFITGYKLTTEEGFAVLEKIVVSDLLISGQLSCTDTVKGTDDEHSLLSWASQTSWSLASFH